MFSNESYIVLYGIVFVSALIACRLTISWVDRTDTLSPLPVPAWLDPYDVAYLRGGRVAVEHLAVLDLIDSGHLNVQRQEASFWRSAPARTILKQVRQEQGLPWHLSAALRRFTTPQKTPGAISKLWDGEWSLLNSALEERLRKDQLLVTERAKSVSRTAWAISLGFLTLGGLVLLKLFLTYGVSINKLIFIGGAMFCLTSAACDSGRLSKRGKAYLARLQLAYRRKPVVQLSPATTAGGANVALIVAFSLFGAERLQNTPYEFLVEMSDSGDSGDGGDGGGDD